MDAKNQILAALANDPNVDSAFRRILAGVPEKGLSAEDKVRKLRLALEGLLDLVDSFEDVVLTRDLPHEEAMELYTEGKAYARHVLTETK